MAGAQAKCNLVADAARSCANALATTGALWAGTMNAIPPTFGLGQSRTGQARTSAGPSSTSMRWAALGEAGKVVAMLAGVDPGKPDKAVKDFPALVRDAEPWRRELADNGCADLAAVMEPGIAALLAINARGADCRPAARALWGEFTAARSAMLDLFPPSGSMGPRRSA